MDIVDIKAITHQVLWLTFIGTALLGALMQKTGFCTMGAVSDYFIMSRTTRLKQWFLAIGVAILGVASMSFFGLIDTTKTIYTASRFLYLSTIFGSILFGIGMVLASGCGSKTLVRIGGGNLKSVVVFLILGLTAYMTLKGFLGVLRVNSFDTFFVTFNTPQDLPSLLAGNLNIDKKYLHILLAVVIGGCFLIYSLNGKESRDFENLFAGIGVGLSICVVWWVSGCLGHIAEDPNTLEEIYVATNSGRMESLSFVSPYAYTLDWLMLYSDTSKTLTIGIAAVIGMITGSSISSLIFKTFRWESFRDVEDTGNHFIGAVLMGFGGVTALGCTIGQGLSGISTLAISSFLALPGYIFGAYIGVRYLQWRLAPNPC